MSTSITQHVVLSFPSWAIAGANVLPVGTCLYFKTDAINPCPWLCRFWWGRAASWHRTTSFFNSPYWRARWRANPAAGSLGLRGSVCASSGSATWGSGVVSVTMMSGLTSSDWHHVNCENWKGGEQISPGAMENRQRISTPLLRLASHRLLSFHINRFISEGQLSPLPFSPSYPTLPQVKKADEHLISPTAGACHPSEDSCQHLVQLPQQTQ